MVQNEVLQAGHACQDTRLEHWQWATATSLLQLPDECLQAVLRFHAHDPITLFSAARAHSRLQQAAAVVPKTLKMAICESSRAQQQINSLLTYSSRYVPHIRSVDISSVYRWSWDMLCSPRKIEALVCELPAGLQLRSLRLEAAGVQLSPCGGLRGVLEGLTSLTLLQLLGCTLLEEVGCPTVPLEQLLTLQHLEVTAIGSSRGHGAVRRRSLLSCCAEADGPHPPPPSRLLRTAPRPAQL